jgi:predicted dehydrogenase
MKSSKKVLQVGHSERFHEAWEILNKVPDLFQAPSLMRLERLSPYHSRSKDVDVVSDLMIHDIDLLLYLLKERPSKVQAVGSKTKSDHLDQAIVSFSFPGGHHAVVTAHRDYVLADRNFEITNKFGTIYIDLVKNKIVSNFNLETGAEGQFEINYTKRDHLFLEQDSFYESILNGQENKCTFEEGIEACKLSLQIINLVHAGNS